MHEEEMKALLDVVEFDTRKDVSRSTDSYIWLFESKVSIELADIPLPAVRMYLRNFNATRS